MRLCARQTVSVWPHSIQVNLNFCGGQMGARASFIYDNKHGYKLGTTGDGKLHVVIYHGSFF